MKYFERSLFWARGRCVLGLVCLALGLGRAAAAVYYMDSQSGDDAGFPKGRIIPDNGGRDFFGRPVPEDRPPAIGASEAIAP